MNVPVDVATVRLSHPIDFVCTSCGHRARADVRVEAEGAATVNATAADSRVVAEERAADGARKSLERALLRLRCPACQQLDPAKLAAWRRDRLGAAATVAVLGAIGGGLGFIVFNPNFAIFMGACTAFVCVQPVVQALRPPPVDVTFTPLP